ncbi:lytic transglycosylase domain-containing protein [Microbaculum marinum]|uniref:Lytic transglycosylase domain-containing protein n=1 Tax=Microbaculum marinum TaxID=1764581 RepID=A0AAW9RMW6_9HYPH
MTVAFALPAIALPATALWAATSVPLPRERPVDVASGIAQTATDEVVVGTVADGDTEQVLSASDFPLPRPRPDDAGPAAHELFETAGFDAPVVDAHTAAVTNQAINFISAKRYDDALALQKTLSDPAARKLIEFYYVRDYSLSAPYSRMQAFLKENPDWPNQDLIRRRFEVALLAQRASAETVIEAFADEPPITSPGVIVYASALKATGAEERSGELIRALWRTQSLTTGEESLVLSRFADALEREDHKKRMDMLLYNGESSAALRVAAKLGGNEKKLAEARIAVSRRSSSAGSALDNLPQEVRSDPGYLLSRIQWNRRADRDDFAAKLLLEASFEPDQLVDPDEWALERRIVARELVETGNPDVVKTAYELVSKHAAESAIDRLENEWHAGWIALRFLKDPEAASKHFAEILNVATTPISTSRAHYWLGRAAEEAGDIPTALKYYTQAGEQPTTYYGQLALNRIGKTSVPRPDKPLIADTARRIIGERDSIRAMRLLVQIGREDEAARFMITMAEETDDPLTLVGICETAQQLGMTWGTVWMGKRGTRAGAPTEAYAFSTDGMPDFPKIGPGIDPAVVYAIARQESVFNPSALSPAGARGLMQMMPATAKATAQAYGQTYNLDRLTSDPTYNATLGAAHLGELAERFDNAYALVFAAYNAGPGRVYEWIERFGDPRKGEIDPVDWVELIPYNETRNYVQRVMEGLQVYRARLGEENQPLLIAEDLRLPLDTGQSVIAAATSAGDAGNNGVPGVFSGFGDGPVNTGAPPSTALGFGSGL